MDCATISNRRPGLASPTVAYPPGTSSVSRQADKRHFSQEFRLLCE